MTVLRVNNVGKSFREYRSEWHRFARWFGLPVRQHEEHWVLQRISFNIHPGEAIGIVGQNGAGKSTLLKMITGTLHPSEGTVEISGRISAILELGMGFNAELSGRENARHASGLMGFSATQIHDALPEIEAFAEIGEYFDEPVRTYSSGMQMRVAFAVATAWRPQILIVDEALSVGDAYFSQKCIARIRRFKSQGTTLLFVSHDPTAVKTLCDRAILLDKGLLIMDSSPEEILDYYNALIAQKEEGKEIQQVKSSDGKTITRSGNKRATLSGVQLLNNQKKSAKVFQIDDEIAIRCKIEYHYEIENATLGFMIRDRLGNDIFGTNTFHLGYPLPVITGQLVIEFHLKLALGVGNYSISIASHTDYSHVADNHDWWDQALVFQVIPSNKPFSLGVASLPVTVRSSEDG